jgi:fermentation-respiration switch protein FrsA (DUF1100 family)
MSKIDVTFDSAGITIAGHLYLPDTRTDKPLPAIVVGHPGTGVKEQVAGLYARLLCDQGFVTLAFDAAFQGESGGEPRGMEDPGHRVEDIKNAVSFLATRDEVDPNMIAALGICASGGYVLAAAASDHRITSIATLSAVDLNRQFRLGADGTQDPAVFQSMLDAAAEARNRESRGASAQSFRLFPATAADAHAAGGQHALEGYEYYCTERAGHPRSAKTLTWSSVDKVATFDSFGSIELIGQRPLLAIVGRSAVTAWMSLEAVHRARGPKELHWVEGASHIDLYDKPEYVTPVIAKLAEFYRGSMA